MPKREHSPEWMIARVQEYLNGSGSYETISKKNGIGTTTLRGWVHKYNEQGAAAFAEQSGNRQYSKEFKIRCVKAILQGEGTVNDIVAKYNISDRAILRSWIRNSCQI